jgi:isoquinoline 1-oxidoreductase subunit beta
VLLRRLELTDLRSYDRAVLEPGPGATVLVGPNAHGKTNLLEAIHRLATGSSHRVAGDGPLVRVGADDIVTVLSKHIEFGQGPFTGLATLVAEEMDADWSNMRVEHAPSDPQVYKNFAFGIQGTGGSTAIANSYEQMRKAGATA